MVRRYSVVFAMAMLLIAGVCGIVLARTDEATRTSVASSPAVQYVETILASADHIEENLPAITEAAEQAADRLVAGGNLYSAADEEGFAGEPVIRAGGMMMMNPAPGDPGKMGDLDVVLVGTLNLKPDQQREELRAMREAGALVILFGSDQSPLKDEVDFLIGSGLPSGMASVVTIEGRSEPIYPAGPAGNAAALWVFTGELVAACTRRGEMPTMFLSNGLPGAGEWNGKYHNRYAFHPDMQIDPVPPGQLGQAYLTEIRRCLEGMRDHQIPALQEGGRRIANAIHAGYTAWAVTFGGHMCRHQLGLPGDPGFLDPSYATSSGGVQLLSAMNPGDALVYMGWTVGSLRPPDALREKQFPSVMILGAQETVSFDPYPWEIYVDPYWEYGHSCVEIPGYDIKILPSSAVAQIAALWMIVGEIAAVPIIGSAAMTPGVALAGQTTRLEIVVDLDVPAEDAGSVRQVSLDLSSLGVSSKLLLDDVGERRYTGSTTVMSSEIGEHILPIEVVIETAEGDEHSYLSVELAVYPDGDMSVYEDGPGDGWAVEATQAESDLNSSAFVRNGNSSQAILLQPSVFPGRVDYIFDDPEGIDPFGYSHLEFYLNGGEASGQDPSVGGKKLSERGVVVASDTWTLVSVPLSELGPVGGRLRGFRISGAVKEAFYIDDMLLVAQEPPATEPTAIETSEERAMPSGYSLSQNYPNPFNPETTIRYALPVEGRVSVTIYNTSGQRIRTLVEGEQTAGYHHTVWDGQDDSGQAVASGLYLCRVICGEFSSVRKLLLVR